MPTQRWTNCLGLGIAENRSHKVLLGVLPGEGIGPEVVGCALDILDSVAQATGLLFEVRFGGPIGRDAERLFGDPLTAEIVEFCDDIFAAGGAVLNGPGGGRYVYDLRRHFQLFFKISPLRSVFGVPDASRLRREHVEHADILIARENCGGIYQGRWNDAVDASGQRVAEHHAQYTASQVLSFLQASARLAAQRSGKLTVVWKESGLPSISRLWRDYAAESAEQFGVRFAMVDIDLMAYRLIQEPHAFDVVAAPNLCGDVLADLGAVLLGSRGLTFSGNYSADGRAVYQTNHGAAYELAGTDRANPAGQILSLAMLLRETFGLDREAHAMEQALRDVWNDGWRTEDVAAPGMRVVGTRQFASRVAQRAGVLALQSYQTPETFEVPQCA